MTVWGLERERRAEFRIPMECPVVLRREDAEEAREGVMENLSRFGAQVLLRQGDVLEAGTAVQMDFDVRGDRHQATGTVRWCRAEKETSRMGLLLDGPLRLSIPLEDVASVCARLSQEMASTQPASNETALMLTRTLVEHHVPLYWGNLFWILSDAAHVSYACAAGNVNLNVFRLERFLAALSVRSADEKAWTGARSALEELKGPEQRLRNTALLFRLVKDKALTLSDSFKGLVNLDVLLSASLHDFQHALGLLTDNGLPSIRFERHRVRPLTGRRLDFARCFENLILFIYQSALFGKARVIDAEIQENADGIHIFLSHDGMQIMDKPKVEIRPLNPRFLEELVPRDVRNGLWLHGSLLPVQEYSPSLVVHSEAGKNRIVVQFPWPEGKAMEPSDLES